MAEKAEKPQPLKEIDWHNVKTMAEYHMSMVFDEGGDTDNRDRYIFEAVMEAVYGHKVWEVYNQQVGISLKLLCKLCRD